jgi:3-deoxy-manno-octulosonate cytidylyltransferase (CMP-KDO synthetase)
VADIVGIIPARYDAKRLPGKPLALIQDRPMIQHVHERALRATSLQRLVVATDDPRIHVAVVDFGGESLMTSPDHASGTDRVAETARQLNLPEDAIVVNIQGDEPLLQPEVVDDLISALTENPEIPMATLAHPGGGSEDFCDPSVVKVVLNARGHALYFSRAPIPASRDDLRTPTFHKHLGLYAYRNSFLQHFTTLPPGVLENLERLEQLRALEHGFSIKVVVTTFDSISVDTAEDLERVRKIMAE